ncbi:Nucleoside-diphosphate-sugar epimerase [Andreprevotia lacus DSM 23236]|uniref:Nucleoside-diphosphate-sugar epimerase n=1 Tax=Andreprevotia lacus DSM 23236 TaxID=1121001 RepID=A0A1W1XYI5_9NEIS|nr:NAD-dependent epimerase/dehydratase family protein [Andreprevotia lacus]SMC28621.1 Nucleoside-diphosphate-sugar epimerase [Andreprevotia lacus DSM 23236]
MNATNKVLVVGASGGIGGEVARQLRDAGWQVRGLKRQLGAPVVHKDGIEWRDGDAMNAADVAKAAAGCCVIVHAVNPPGYRRWGELVLPMLDNTIAAARANRATIVLPGTVYNYGPDAFPLISEDAPQQPRTRKGAIRVDMERRLEAAAASGEARVIIVRAGDFFGPSAGNSWFAQGMVKPGQPVKLVNLPGPGVGHQFAYLPDVAQTMLRLLARRDALPAFARYHMQGHWDADGSQLAQSVQRVVAQQGGGKPAIKPFPWWMIRLASPLVATLRELLEMRYLWREPVRMDNARLVAVLGEEPHTPLDVAVKNTLVGMGCLPAAAA